MSSAFTVAERALARLALAHAEPGNLDVLVGGLGLGYTAAEALGERRVAQLVVVEALGPVIDWHARRLLVEGDFFALVRTGELAGLSADGSGFDAILLDIDHTPTHHLASSHSDFYTTAGVERLRAALRPGGVFGLWSDESAGEEFLELLLSVFTSAEEHDGPFQNPITRGTSANTVYLART